MPRFRSSASASAGQLLLTPERKLNNVGSTSTRYVRPIHLVNASSAAVFAARLKSARWGTGAGGAARRPADAARLSLSRVFRKSGHRFCDQNTRKTIEPLRRDRRDRAVLDQRNRLAQHIDAGARPDAVFREMAAECARPRYTMIRADEMPRD